MNLLVLTATESVGIIGIIANGIKAVMDAFGSSLVVPLVVFLLSIIMGVNWKKAGKAAIYMAIGLTAFGLLLGIMMGDIGGAVNQMVANTGVDLSILDIGWPAAATIVYSNNLGLMYLIVGLVWQILLFFIGLTDTFQPTDIWNYYYFVVWAIMVEFVSGSFLLGLVAALFMNLFVLFVADVLAPSLQEYYGYDGLTCTCICVTNISVFAALIHVLTRGRKKEGRTVDAEALQRRFGFWGESITIGLILGFVIGLLANIRDLNTLGGWAGAFRTALVLAVVMHLYPTVSGLFVQGLVPLSNEMNTRIRSSSFKRDFFHVGMDPAIFVGDTSNLTVGLILIPLLILTAIVLPGANIVPLADIPSMTLMAVGLTGVFHGDIIKGVVTGTIYYSLAHYIATDTASLFTEMAVIANVEVGAGQLIHSWCIAAQPPLYVIYKAFAAEGTLKIFTIAACVVVYVLCLVHFKRNRKKWYMAFGATEEYVDNYLEPAPVEA